MEILNVSDNDTLVVETTVTDTLTITNNDTVVTEITVTDVVVVDDDVVVTETVTTEVVTTDEVTSVITLDPDVLIVEDTTVDIITVGILGPAGPPGTAAGAFSLEAGEDLTAGDPVYVSANKLYVADNTTNFRVVGIAVADTLLGFSAEVALSGPVTLAGLSNGSPYYLGSGTITTAAPASGYVVRLGYAIGSTTLIVNIEEPILLA